MLENMRNHAQSWMAKLILGGVALSFVLWGIGDYFRHSQIQDVATVDGAPITDGEFNLAYEQEMNRYRSMLGKSFSKKMMQAMGVKQQTLQTLINRRLILDEAGRMGLVAPQQVLVSEVRSNPAFQSAGHFDVQRYEALTRNLGYRTPTDFEASLRLDLIATALQRALTQSATVSEDKVHANYEHRFEQRELAALVVDPSSLEKKVSVDDKQAHAYFDAHRHDYRSPLQLTMNVVTIDPKKLAADMSVDEAAIKKAYEDHKDRYTKPETRHARHILITLPKDANSVTKKAARARIDKALKQIKAGKSFASVARRFSEDKATAKNGGDLGYLASGATVPAFNKVLFSLKKGEVSKVFETRFGLHIIKLEDIKPEHVQALAEVHERIKQELALAKANDEAYKLSEDLDDALGREDTLKAAAGDVNLKTVQYGPLSIDAARAYPVFGKASSRAALFERHPGDTIDVNELDNGTYVAIEILRRDKPADLPFDKVSKKVFADARHAAATEQARKLADEMRKQAASTALDKLAQKHGLPLYLSKPVRSDGAGDRDADWLSQDVLQAAFDLKQGAVAPEVLKVSKGFAIVQVKHIIPADPKGFEEQKASIRKALLRNEGVVRFARWMADTRARHDIKINQDVLEKF